MNILVGFERSQEVCKAFRKKGHRAHSLDIMPCYGDRPEWHIIGDARSYINDWWDMVILFPPCTHIAVSGSRHFAQKRRDGRQQEAIKLFMDCAACECDKLIIENPVGIMSTIWRKADQIIQPHQFGEDASKKTCLWLRGVPLLKPTMWIPPRIVNGKKRWGNQTDSGQNKLCPSKDRSDIRSKTYPGIAKAMADQWG